MIRIREWLKPPRSLLLLLCLVTCVSVSALAWFGWKLLDQERLLESQRAQEHLEQAADRVAALARGTLAETGERVGSWLISPPRGDKPDDGLLLIVARGAGSHEPTLNAFPHQRLLYRPFGLSEPEDQANVFAEAEGFEFQQGLPDRAAEAYRRLAESKSAALRAGALMRWARVLRKSGRKAEARAAYLRVTEDAAAEASFGSVPSGLAARLTLCQLSGQASEARDLLRDLREARWPITKAQLGYYWAEASQLAGMAEKPTSLPVENSAIAAAAQQWWANLANDGVAAGQATIWVEDHPFFALWRGTKERRAVLIIRPENLMKQIVSAGATSFAAVDADGRVVAGRRNGAMHAAVRTPVETRLPWTLYLNSTPGENEAGILVRQRFLLLATGVMVVFLIAGAYFIARAIQSDLAVARMQSDFVSAVSHEFRSPLTSIRQLSELLALGRIPNEDRRQVYYQTLVRESTRLQRLVEGLLNFGRMEAGARKYRFEALDTADLVTRVAAEFEIQMAGSGRHIELDGAYSRCTIDADPEAMSVALRNLVDNALKYAPDCPTVRVEWGVEKSSVAIRVRDQGPGVAVSERRAIFRKFVRGTAAEAANVRGSGVGLAMVRHIVAAHGGVVQLASEPGAGSVFTILLPLGLQGGDR